MSLNSVQCPIRLVIGIVANYCFPITPINMMPSQCSGNICHKVAFNNNHNKQQIFKVNKKSTKKQCKGKPKINQNKKKQKKNKTWQTSLSYLCYETWIGFTPNTEAAVSRCSLKYVFLKISLYSQKNTCNRLYF